MRNDGRDNQSLRDIKITPDFLRSTSGSALMELGNTRVICAATIEDGVPQFLRGLGRGWLTAEYSMLPAATDTRSPRESVRGKISGRTHEIQRLIGRSLRSVVNLNGFGERTVHIDCDVIQADGGTRTASITGAFVALALLFQKMIVDGRISSLPLGDYIAAVSIGVVGDEVLLDLNYEEDSQAEIDANIVITGEGKFTEIQATAEGEPFPKSVFEEMLSMATKGITQMIAAQKEIVGGILR